MMKRKDFFEIWKLTWPQILMLLSQAAVGFTDVWATGRIGPGAQAAFGLICQCQTVLLILASSLAVGAVAAVSQSIGASDRTQARKYSGFIIFGGALCGLAIALSGQLFSDGLLQIIRTPYGIRREAGLFLFVNLWTVPAQYVLTLGGAVFRADKIVKLPLFIVLSAALVNIFGDLAFGLGYWDFPAFGINGIAWSTFAAVNLAAAVMIFFLFFRGMLARDSAVGVSWVKKYAPYVFKVSVPSFGSSFLWSAGSLVLCSITTLLPDGIAALAGYTAGLRIESLLFLPAAAFSMTASVLVGQALGAGDNQEARRDAGAILAAGCAAMTLAGAAMWPFRSDLALFLTPDHTVSVETAKYLTFNILSVPFTVASVILSGVMGGAGATRYVLYIYGFSVWMIRLPFAWAVGYKFGYGTDGVFGSMLISQLFQASMLVLVLFRCDWQKYALKRERPA